MQSTVTLVGNLVDDVRVRDTPSGPVAHFRMAASTGWYDRRQQRWVDRSAYLEVSAWRRLAENVAVSLCKGQPVIVVGRLRQREYERDGQRVTAYEVDAELVGHDLGRGSAMFARNARGPQTSELAAVAPGPAANAHDDAPAAEVEPAA